MPDYVNAKEYAAIHNLPYEAVKTRVRYNLIPFIRVGRSTMIDKNEPWVEMKRGKQKGAKVDSRKPKYKVEITRAYYVAVVDSKGKEIVSDFTFLSKAEAEKLGAKMKKEVEGKYND